MREFQLASDGALIRRRELLEAEKYFGFRGDVGHDWNAVRRSFVEALEYLKDAFGRVKEQ